MKDEYDSSNSKRRYYDGSQVSRQRKHKKHTSRECSPYIEIVESKRRHTQPEIIEVHASSSEASESSEGEIESKQRYKCSNKGKRRRCEDKQREVFHDHRHNDDHKKKRKHHRHESSHKRREEKRSRREDRSSSSDNSSYRRRKRQEERELLDTIKREMKEDKEREIEAERNSLKEKAEKDRNALVNHSPTVKTERELNINEPKSAQSRIKEEPSGESDDKHGRHNSRVKKSDSNRDKRQQGSSGGPRKPRDQEDKEYDWGKSNNDQSKVKDEPTEKDKPDFALSGKLTEDRNMFNGVVIKYSEPPEARMPKKRWRLYPFKGEQAMPTLYIHRQSAYLIGRDRKVADLPVDHPSCSKQHAALQYRLVSFQRPNGTIGKAIRLYLIDLESANGTFVNSKKIEARKYVELLEKDVIKFGFSSREYVLLHEGSKGEESDDE